MSGSDPAATGSRAARSGPLPPFGADLTGGTTSVPTNMANPNPHRARRAKREKRRAKPGDVKDVQARVWEAVEAACAVLHDPETDNALRLRAVHAVTQAAGSYTKIIEAAEFEARLEELERKVDEGGVI